MPLLTKAQHYALDTLRRLLCVRHSHMDEMMGREFSGINPGDEMRRLSHLGKVKIDGGCYCWPGCAPREERLIALDIMMKMSGSGPLVYDIPAPPCKLLFFVAQGSQMQAVRLYFPEPGKEVAYAASAAAQQLPPNHIAVFYIQDEKRKPLLNTSRPHLFVLGNENDGYRFQRE